MKEIFRDSTKAPAERAADLLSRLTTAEKVGQINQRLYGFHCYKKVGDTVELSAEFKAEVERFQGLGTLYGLYRADPWADKTYETGLTGEAAVKAYNAAQRYVVSHSRFGIPMLLSTECPHGHQALDGYLLPVSLAMGASWNPALVEAGFHTVGRQLSEMGVDLALISVLDVLRDPRWGRSEECFSEDPYLSAVYAAAAVRGCTAAGVEAVVKHFCAQGETTGGVNASAARIGERELREIHLPPMAAAAKAGAKGVMAAYNEIDGVPCHANEWLLKDVLRGEMGFDGVVMADGCAVDRLNVLTGGDDAANGALALCAGVDISLWDSGFSALEEAVTRGLVSMGTLDDAVLRVLEIKFARGLFEHPYLGEKPLTDFNSGAFSESRALAEESAVLLKNDGILPLAPEKYSRVAVIGPNADAMYRQLGDYTPPVKDGVGSTLHGALKDALGEGRVRFLQGTSVCGGETDEVEAAARLAAESDVVILALGGSSSRFSGAEFDTNGAAIVGKKLQMDCGEGMDASSLALPGAQNALFEAVIRTGTPTVSVVIAGRPYAVPEVAEKSRALLWAFYPGPWGGEALADILLGRVNPSGCLPVSLPRRDGQLPVYYNARASYDAMRYRDLPNTPLYPFGFGLSYTSFETENVRADFHDGTVRVSLSVRNTGDRAGKPVLQLFIAAQSGSVVRRVRELKAFRKITLKPGEVREMTLTPDQDALRVWNRRMQFVTEAGDVSLHLTLNGTEVWQGTVRITG